MSIAINVRDVGAAEVIGTSFSPENSNTVIGLIKRIYTLLSNFVTRFTNLTTRVDSIAETVEDLSSLGENQGSSLLGLVEQVNSNGTRITNLENTNQTINSNINSNTNRISALETVDNQIGGRISALESADQTLNSNISSNTNRISALESADNQIGGQIASLNSQINTNSDNILDNRTRIISVENTVTSNTNRISALESADQTINSNISSNTNRISALESVGSTNSSNISTLQSTVNTNSTNITQIQEALNKYVYFCRSPNILTFSFCAIGSVYFEFWNTSTNRLNVSKTYVVPIQVKYLEGHISREWVSNNNIHYYPYSLSFKIAFGDVGTVANPYTFLEYVVIKTHDPLNGNVSREFAILPRYNIALGESYWGNLPGVFLKRSNLLKCAETSTSRYFDYTRFWIRDVNSFNFTPGPSDVIQIIDGEFWSATNPNKFLTQPIVNELI